MLKNIKIKNFYSIGEEQEMSFEINKSEALDDSARLIRGSKYANTVSCVIGANASGKTNFIKALTFIGWFVKDSYSSLESDKKIPIELHKLKKSENCKIEIEFLDGDFVYNYSIELSKDEVKKEILKSKKNVQRAVFSTVFELVRLGDKVEVEFPKLKLNAKELEHIKRRKNISLLSALLFFNYLPQITFFGRFASNVSQLGLNVFVDVFDLSERLNQNKELLKELLNFSNEIDFGITKFDFKELTLRNTTNPTDEIKKQMLICTHKSKSKEFVLPIIEESDGTQQAYGWFSVIFPILMKGGVVLADELESNLHPYVAKKIISLFESKETNPLNAQLIFSTHQHLLINDRTKTQIFITEKNSDLETEIYRLDDVEGVGVRNDENFFHKYMAGAYGGTPNISWI